MAGVLIGQLSNIAGTLHQPGVLQENGKHGTGSLGATLHAIAKRRDDAVVGRRQHRHRGSGRPQGALAQGPVEDLLAP